MIQPEDCPFDVAEAVAHVQARVDAAPVETDPFPHMVIRELFPAALYDRLVEGWPPEASFYRSNAYARQELTLPLMIERVPTALLPFWHGVMQVAGAANRRVRARLLGHFAAKFAPILGADWAAKVEGVPFIEGDGAHLATYHGNIHLPAHTDHARIVINAFTYVSESAAPEPDLGTVLYRSHGLMLPTNIVLSHADLSRCVSEAKTVPYRANDCLAFVNAPTAFHGVRPVDIGERRRRLLMFATLYGPEESIRVFGPALGASGPAASPATR